MTVLFSQSSLSIEVIYTIVVSYKCKDKHQDMVNQTFLVVESLVSIERQMQSLVSCMTVLFSESTLSIEVIYTIVVSY